MITNNWIFHLTLSGVKVKRFAVLVSKNTRVDERPWRLNVINVEDNGLALPHLLFDEPPTTVDEVEHHLSTQLSLYPEFQGELRVQAA